MLGSRSALLQRNGLAGRSAGRTRLVAQARAARYDRRKPPPPDLPSLLFDQRIVYLGMPVRTGVPAASSAAHELDPTV